MPRLHHLRSPSLAQCVALAFVCIAAARMQGQTPAPDQIPASLPAGVLTAPALPAAAAETAQPQISAKQAREADDAYLEAARLISRKDLAGTLAALLRAVQLNPGNRDYALALIVTRGNRVSELVRLAATARSSGDTARADALLEQARSLDPDNAVVAQHFPAAPRKPAARGPVPASELASTLSGPIELDANPAVHSFHLQADPRSLLRNVYSAYGIETAFDATVQSGGNIAVDMDNVSFADATRVILQLTRTFAVPIQPKQALLVRDTPEGRQEFQPQIEETVYLPGYSQEQMTELATVARTVFDLRQVTASATQGFILLRGDEESLKLVNATYAEMLDGGADVLFDVNLYEINTSKIRNIGATLPASYNAFDLLSAGQSLIASNQTLLQQAISNQVLIIPAGSSASAVELEELLFLVGAGVSGAAQFTNLLGIFGTYDGLPLIGVSLLTGSTFNLMLNSTDSRLLDAVQVRGGNGQPASFRAGSRYPVITGSYSSGISSTLASQLSGLNINGTSVSNLLKQYLGSTQTSIPQFQFEDLGITLKLTPHIQHGNEVNVAVDMKIEALGGTSINNVPVLNNRVLTSTLTIPVGQTALLASQVSRNEIRSIDGLPGLSELPGFQGTDKSKEIDTDELLITVTPHIVRSGSMHIESRALAAVHTQQQ